MRSFRCLTSTAIKEIPEVNFENTRPHVTTKTDKKTEQNKNIYLLLAHA